MSFIITALVTALIILVLIRGTITNLTRKPHARSEVDWKILDQWLFRIQLSLAIVSVSTGMAAIAERVLS